MEVIELHKNWQYMDQCCMLLNSEWPRSMTARSRSLQTSCDSFPTSLMLLQKGYVIGHSKISAIPSLPSACFIESVIIHSDLRGHGLGKVLMNLTEDYTKKKKVTTAYLSTIDKEQFYLKLGYVVCEPVSIYGCSFPIFNESSQPPESVANNFTVAATAPPPPPLPKLLTSNTIGVKAKKPFYSRKVFMKKDL